MHVAKIRRRHGDREYVSHLVRRSVREGKRVRHETVANVSGLPQDAIDALALALKGVNLVPAGEGFRIVRSRKHGHVEAVLGAASRLGLARLLDRESSSERDLCLAMIIQRVLKPGSKLACARSLGASTLGHELSVVGADQDDLYAAIDWLLERQDRIEQRLARRHLRDRVRDPRWADRPQPARSPGCRARLQTTQRSRERVPRVQRPARGPSDRPPPRGPRPRPPADLHARLLPPLALRQAWTELLGGDHNPAATTDPIAKATRSPSAIRKASTRRTPDRYPGHTLTSLLEELENRTRNTIQVNGTVATFDQLTEPTKLQAHTLALINERIPQLT